MFFVAQFDEKKGLTMDKKRYEELELEVVRFDAEDIVATSGEQQVAPILT